MSTRAKFRCTEIARTEGWDSKLGKPAILATYSFQVVTGGSKENEAFFAATPSGQLKLWCARDNMFEVGKQYYLDLTPADQAVPA